MRLPNLASLRERGTLLLTAAALCLACSSPDDAEHDATCTPDDADGIISEPARFEVTVTDSVYTPKILAAQNSSEITLTLTNEGTTPHGFVVDCLPTPNSDGCPTQSCFPSDSQVDALDPGASLTIVFHTPLVEGIYDFHSDVPQDTELTPGQFIVQ